MFSAPTQAEKPNGILEKRQIHRNQRDLYGSTSPLDLLVLVGLDRSGEGLTRQGSVTEKKGENKYGEPNKQILNTKILLNTRTMMRIPKTTIKR